MDGEAAARPEEQALLRLLKARWVVAVGCSHDGACLLELNGSAEDAPTSRCWARRWR